MEGNEQQQEAAANPPAPDLMGYATPEALAHAKRASDAEAKRLHGRVQELEATLGQLLSPARQEVPQRTQDPYGQLEEIGVPQTHLRAAIQREVEQAFTPLVQQIQGHAQARNHMLASYGKDYVQFEQDVAQHLQSDPQSLNRYNTMFQTDPVAAAEWAFLKFSETKRRESPPAKNGGDGQSREQQAQAAIPSVGQSEGRRPENANLDRVNRAWDAYQKNPNKVTAEQYAKARFSSVISDEFLNR